jgi:tetratricopeptide (TPR) repeat protein
MRLCAFFAPDAIPEEIISDGASELGPVLQPVAADPFELNDAIEVLQKFSLVKRDPKVKTLSIHRLVQVVIRDGMDQQTQRQWAKRAIRAVRATLPKVEYGTWLTWERVVAHAQVCAQFLGRYGIQLPEAAALLQQTGSYLTERAHYGEAESLLTQAYAMSEEMQGPEHPDTATSLHQLAELYGVQGMYEQADPLYQRALMIRKQQLGPEHPDTAHSLHRLAALYQNQGMYEQADPLYQRALAIYTETFGPQHPVTKFIQGNYDSFLEEKQRKQN